MSAQPKRANSERIDATPSAEHVPYAADTFAIRQIGLERWLSHPAWPWPEPDHFAMVENIFVDMATALDTMDREQRDVILSDVMFVDSIAQYLNVSLAAIIAKRKGVALLTCVQPKDFAFDASAVVAAAKAPFLRPTRPRDLVARAAKRALYNRHAGIAAHTAAMFGQAPVWLVGSQSDLKANYLRANALTCDAVPLTFFAKDIRETPSPLWINEFVTGMISSLSQRLAETIGEVPDLTGIGEAWRKRLAWQLAVYRNILALKRVPRVLLVGEVAKSWSKIVAAGLRARGTRVIGANHGYYVGENLHPLGAASLYSPCNEFLCYSHNNARMMAQSLAASPLARHIQTEFTALETRDAMTALAAQFSAPRRSDEIRTVMLVGVPHHERRVSGAQALYFIPQLSSQLEIAQALRQAGFRVIYKMHPERRKEAAGLFDAYVDEVSEDRFEDVWTKADAFVFTNTLTTTFNMATLTDRKIVALDPPDFKWIAEAREAIAHRVSFVSARYDDDGCYVFDASKVVDALTVPNGTTDRTYTDKFLFDKAAAGKC